MATAETLAEKHCVPCEGGVKLLTPEKANGLLTSVPHWKITAEGNRLRRDWRVRDFMAAIAFFERVAEIAEHEDHHPDLHLVGYRNVHIEIWTHAVGGLTENDFILAAKIDQLNVDLAHGQGTGH
jgi:4a-hydroxytetrahydrobiopterin dehydratase